MTTQTHDAIHTRALLVWLTISTWSARKYDRKISQEVNDAHGATSDAGRYNKMLLPGDTKSYKALMSLAGAIRTEHYQKTLAWSDEGYRLLPTAQFMHFGEWYRGRSAEFMAARDAFVTEYPDLRMAARLRLNGMFKAEDYPADQDIENRFSVGVQYRPLPAEGDIRVSLPADQIALIEQSIADTTDRAVQVAVKDAWTRLYTVVDRIRERLSKPDAIFRDSLITNAAELCDELSRLNVTGDQDLETLRLRVLAELTDDSPKMLRENDSVRAAVAIKADQIMADMSALYGGALNVTQD